MNPFRFVLYTWGCSVLLYPFAVMIGDVFTRSNTELRLFLPLLTGALVLGLPLLALAVWTLRLVLLLHIARPLQYALWTLLVLLSVGALLRLFADPTLTGTGEDARFVVPLFAGTLFVLLLRYAWFSRIELPEHQKTINTWTN